MADKPFRTIPAILLSLPGVILLPGVMVTLQWLSMGAFESGNHTVSDLSLLVIGAGLLLVPAALITTPIGIFYAIRRSGSGFYRTFFIVLNGLMLILALACLVGLLVSIMAILGNPG